MTNKFRRSVTSVLLAASLLFSSQSVIAFADYGSKSDTSDLSPVQESVEPVIGESQPMMAVNNLQDNGKYWSCHESTTLKNIDIFFNSSSENIPDDLSDIFKQISIKCESYYSHFGKHQTNIKEVINNILEKHGLEEKYTLDKFEFYHDNSSNHDGNNIYWTQNGGNKLDLYFIGTPGQSEIPHPENDLNKDKEDGWRYEIDVDVECDDGDNDNDHDDAYCSICKNFVCTKCDRRECECDDDEVFNDIRLSTLGNNADGSYYKIIWTNGSEYAEVKFTTDHANKWIHDFNDTLNHCKCDHFFCSFSDNCYKDEKTIALKWEDGKWEVKGDHDVDIDVHCNGEGGTTPDPKPNLPEDLSILGSVNVVCDTASESHNTSYSFKDLNEGTEYTVTGPTLVDNVYQCTVSINAQAILNKYNGSNVTHTLVKEASVTGPVTLTWKNNEWTVDNAVKDSLTVKIHCESEPWTPIVPFPTDDNIKALLDGKIKVVCETVKAHGEKTYGTEVDGGYTPSNEIKFDGTNYTYDLTINYNPYVAQYNDDDTSAKHGLVEPDVFSETVTLTWVPNNKELTGGHWAIDDDLLVTIPVQCEYPTLDQDDLANLWVNFFCINDETHNKEHWTNLASCTAEIDYHIEYDKEGSAEVTLLNPEQFAKAYCDSTLKVPHLYVGYEPESLTLHWNGENWVSYEISRSSDANSFTIGILCGPTDEEVKNLLAANIRCINDKATHEESERYYDQLLDNSFEIGNIIHQSDAEYLCDVTVNPSLYLNDFYSLTGGIEHSLVARTPELGSITVPLLYNIESEQWELVNKNDSPVNFSVACTTQDPIDPPTEEQVEALFDGVVTVDCINPNVVHPTRTYGITKDQFEIGDVWSMVPYANSETTSASFVDVSINVNASHFFNLYDTETGHASINRTGSVPTIIRLMFNNETNAWEKFEPAGSINLTVTCTTGGGTIDPNPNPGGGGDNDDDDDRYTGGNTVTRTINDDDVPLNDRPTNTTTIDDEDVPLADLPDDTVTIDDGEVPLKDNPSTGDSLPFAAMAAAALSLGGVIVLNRKKK